MLQITLFCLTTSILSTLAAGQYTQHCNINQKHREKILNNYVSIWDGNLSLVNETFAPQVSLQIDRFPAGAHGSVDIEPAVNSSATFAAFVTRTRSSLREYKIIPQKWVGQGRGIAVRWVMKGVMGDNFALPTTLKPGDSVTYNGTEYLMLDCGGLIEDVDSAQDLITFMYNLGENINLTPIKAS